MTHPLRPPLRRVAAAVGPTAPAWPSYTGTAQLVGTSASGVTVYVDPTLGNPALQNAQDLLTAADRVVQQNDAIFGISGGAVDVIVFALNGQTDGTGGADHDGCDFTTGNAIEVDASYGNSTRVVALFEALRPADGQSGERRLDEVHRRGQRPTRRRDERRSVRRPGHGGSGRVMALTH